MSAFLRLIDGDLWKYSSPKNIIEAVRMDKVSYVRNYLSCQRDLDFQDSEGDTAIHVACKFNRIKILKLLLKHGDNIEKMNSRGESPLLVALRWRNHDACVTLLQKKANPNLRNLNDGSSPLYNCKEKPTLELLMKKKGKCSEGEILLLLSQEHYIMVYHILDQFPNLLYFKDKRSKQAFFEFLDFIRQCDPIIYFQRRFNKNALK